VTLDESAGRAVKLPPFVLPGEFSSMLNHRSRQSVGAAVRREAPGGSLAVTGRVLANIQPIGLTDMGSFALALLLREASDSAALLSADTHPNGTGVRT
jgi:hypothetical protein